MSDPRTMTGGDWAELSARADARRLPPSDYGSTRAIQSVAALLRETYARGQRDAIAAADQAGSAKVEKAICQDILDIMATYDEQMAENACVDTPGGLEHMGDVWSLFAQWRRLLLPPAPGDVAP